MMRTQEYNLFSVMGPHAGENSDAIFARKITDIRNAGRTFWVVRSHKAKPAVEPERIPHVPPQNDEKHQGQIKKIPVDVLQDQRKRSFAEICLPRLAHGAGRRIRPKSLVIRPAIVVARHSKAARSP
jgi:1,2-phenylacetyl-CoA epoxidase PaaB subunit